MGSALTEMTILPYYQFVAGGLSDQIPIHITKHNSVNTNQIHADNFSPFPNNITCDVQVLQNPQT
jgi:hypothetical protein